MAMSSSENIHMKYVYIIYFLPNSCFTSFYGVGQLGAYVKLFIGLQFSIGRR